MAGELGSYQKHEYASGTTSEEAALSCFQLRKMRTLLEIAYTSRCLTSASLLPAVASRTKGRNDARVDSEKGNSELQANGIRGHGPRPLHAFSRVKRSAKEMPMAERTKVK